MSISETVRATQTEESRQNQTISQNFSANWQNRKVSIISPAAAGVTIGATAIAVAATVLTGGVALAAFVIGGLAIAAGLGTSLFFAFKTPTSLEQSRMENLTPHVPTFEEMLERAKTDKDFLVDKGPQKVPTFEEMLAREVEKSPIVENTETVETPVETPDVEQPTPDKPQNVDDVLQTKVESSYSYGKMALGALGLAALAGAVYIAHANGISLNPLSYFSSPGNVTPEPQPTPNPQPENVTEPVVTPPTNTSTPVQPNNGSYVFTPQPSVIKEPITPVNGSFVPAPDKGPVSTLIQPQCQAPTFNESWTQSTVKGYTPAPASLEHCTVTPTAFNDSTPVPPKVELVKDPVTTPLNLTSPTTTVVSPMETPSSETPVVPQPVQTPVTPTVNDSSKATPSPPVTPVVQQPVQTPVTPTVNDSSKATPLPSVTPAVQQPVQTSVGPKVNDSVTPTPTPSVTPTVVKPAETPTPSAQPTQTIVPSSASASTNSSPAAETRYTTTGLRVELPKTEETSWVSKECMKFGQTLSKRFSEPYNRFFAGKSKDAWTSSDYTNWKMMSSKDTCYYPPKATSIDAARARRDPMVKFCNCMMELWKTRNPAATV